MPYSSHRLRLVYFYHACIDFDLQTVELFCRIVKEQITLIFGTVLNHVGDGADLLKVADSQSSYGEI